MDINKCQITTEFLPNSTHQILLHLEFFLMINVIVMNTKEINNHLPPFAD